MDALQKSSGGCFSRSVRIRTSDTDMYRHLRMSRLSALLQEISIAHTEALGFPRETTLDRGLLWVITRLRIRLSRPILYDETIRLETWPEPMIHMVYPRGCRILDEKDECIGQSSALWTIIDGASRRIALPARTGILIPGIHLENELPLPEGLSVPDGGESACRTAAYSEIDLNGHVNNTRYFDWIDDLFDPQAHRKGLYREIQMNFLHEITPGAAVRLVWKTEKEAPAPENAGAAENTGAAALSACAPGGRILRVCGFTEESQAAFAAEAVMR